MPSIEENVTQVNLFSLQGVLLFTLLAYKLLDIRIAGTEEYCKLLTHPKYM